MTEYRYDLVTEIGDTDEAVHKIEKIINEYARAGWRVHTFIHEGSNEVRSAAWVALLEQEVN